MALEYELRNGALVWIRSPVTGVTSYVVDVRGKSFAFTLAGRRHRPPDAPPMGEETIRHATSICPFCPGNEKQAPGEIFRLGGAEVPGFTGDLDGGGDGWVIRVINNLFPRIPAQLTGGRNESYVVIEDPRHFVAVPRSPADLMCTGLLGEPHFLKLIDADASVMRRALENPHVRSIVIRKNQGRESGASQPHIHQQIIGAPDALPALAAELRAERENPGFWNELLDLMDRLGLVIDNRDGVATYASPIGAFPRSYDVLMPAYRGLLTELSEGQLGAFARSFYRLLRFLGPIPLDYEIHQHPGLPLHAHINVRLYPYSNVAGTLNIPSALLENTAAFRKLLGRG
jgi:UDPglucose--hexose-1-phosphate uridylyltransferase